MSRIKQSVVIIHGGQAFLMSLSKKNEFLVAMLRGGSPPESWPDFCTHLGPVLDAEQPTEKFLTALTGRA